MIHLIYDMDNGIAIADNKVSDYTNLPDLISEILMPLL